MYEYLDDKNHQQSNNKNPDKQDEIARTLKETKEQKEKREKQEIKERMDNDIKIFQKLIQWYYDVDSEGDDRGKDVLYTLIRYEGKEELVRVGTGVFTPEMFTDKQVSDTVGFLYGPLSLYVVKANHHDDIDVDPKDFLDEHASFYSPIGGKVYVNAHHIEYGKYNKIPSYDEAKYALYNASIRKVFYDRISQRNNVQEKIAKKIDQLKKKTYEELKVRYETDQKFNQDNEEYLALHAYIQELSGGDLHVLYEILQHFDRHKGIFIPQYGDNK